jgi:ABC-type transport system involved in cytochrome c biogenesis permease subunit
MAVPILYAVSVLLLGRAAWTSLRYYRSLEEGHDQTAGKWLSAALLSQGVLIAVQWIQTGYPPLLTLSGILLVITFSLGAVLWMGRLKSTVPLLTSLFLPLVFFLALMGFAVQFRDSVFPNPSLMTIWMAFHIFSIFLGFACFTLGFGVGLAFWIQEGQLKRHQIKAWSFRLPPLELLDRLTVFFIGWGFLFWGTGLVLGVYQAFLVWHQLPLGDPKILGAFLVLLIYAGFFLARWGFKIRGRKTMVLVMLGYFLALFTFVGVQVFLQTQHLFWKAIP